MCAVTAAVGLGASGCGSREDEGTAAVPRAPEGLVRAANFHGVDRTAVVAELAIGNLTKEEYFGIGGVSEFENLEGEGPPRMLIQINANGLVEGNEVDFNSYATVFPDEAMIVYGPSFGESQYDVEPGAFRDLKSKFEDAIDGKGSGSPLACLEAAKRLDLSRLVPRFVREEGPDKDRYGERVTWIGGKIDVDGFLDSWIALAEDPGCASQLRALGSPSVPELEAAKKALRGRVEDPKVLLAIDENGVPRILTATALVKTTKGEEFSLKAELRLYEKSQFKLRLQEGGESFDSFLRPFGGSEGEVREAGAGEIVTGFLRALAQAVTGNQ
ncbi:MAG: hypothetical protein ACJ76B_05015 [Solirubrobacterales bacterium]